MSVYTPEFKETVSENAKMIVTEDDGKVYVTNMPKSEEVEKPDMIIEFEHPTSYLLADVSIDNFKITHGTIESIFDMLDNRIIPHIEIKQFRGRSLPYYTRHCSRVRADVCVYYDYLYILFMVYDNYTCTPTFIRLVLNEDDGISQLYMKKVTTE